MNLAMARALPGVHVLWIVAVWIATCIRMGWTSPKVLEFVVIEHPAAGSKPPLDEESFTRLLAAAYVMQEHQDRVRTRVSPADLTEIIAQVVETQHEIQSRRLGSQAAFDLIAKRLCSVARAAGVALATVDADNLRYCAGAGSAATLVSSEIFKQASLAASCLKTGVSFQSPLAQSDPRLDSTQCRKLGAQSLLAVPLYHDGQIAGAIEMYFSQVSAFGESETRAAELMAGVASEVIADAAEQEVKEELEAERASVRQALEMLEPQLQNLSGDPAADLATPAKPETELCRACGHAFIGNETFCGLCGASRATGMYPGAALQSKWAVLWERHLSGAEQDGMPLFRKTPPTDASPPTLPADFATETHASVQAPQAFKESSAELVEASVAADDFDSHAASESAAIELSPWTSAAQAQEWLSEHHPEDFSARLLRVVRHRPGDASLYLAALVLLITLVWTFWPRAHNASLAQAQTPATATVKRRPRPKPPTLTLFEKALVGLGLAVPPPTPAYMGDPNVKVWEDLETGLYYCPDTDLYGTTAKGNYTTQAEAQQDAFEPAFRKPCD